MYDMTADLQVFYDEHVRLGKELRDELARYRDLNLSRVNAGLDQLADETGRSRPHPYDYKNQGGYAMHTLNKAMHDDYDIDVALLFRKADLPDDPLSARQRVCDALLKKCVNFSKEPEVRTNAVTVWYPGHHIDFAIYRTSEDFWGGSIIEHASTEWKRRDPMEVNDWFAAQVTEKSPKPSFLAQPRVASGQLRRIVRFLKWFCRSRSSWCLPGGMVVTALAVECYRPDADRDDVALYKTLVAVKDRLCLWTTVNNPVGSSELTSHAEVLKQVERLRDNLKIVVPKLSPLLEAGCTREKARSAWDWVFNHDFWARKESSLEKAAALLPYSLQIRCGLARSKGGTTYKEYPSSGFVLPKGVHLKFSVAQTDVPLPHNVRWTVDNEGDEAADGNDRHWEKEGQTCWTSTKYKGNQRMMCEVERNGQVLARAKHFVKISGNGRWGAA